MKTSAVLVAAGLAASAVAQLGDLPRCALTCLLSNAPTSGCAETTDFECLCSSGPFIDASITCVRGSCSEADIPTAIEASRALCASVGVIIDLPGDDDDDEEPEPSSTAPAPTEEPTEEPTAAPTEDPTAAPTEEPTSAAPAPTEDPDAYPTEEPVPEPTGSAEPIPAPAPGNGTGNGSTPQPNPEPTQPAEGAAGKMTVGFTAAALGLVAFML